MSIKRIDVVPVYVNDQDKAQEFYVNRLGMETVRDDPMGPYASNDEVRAEVLVGVPAGKRLARARRSAESVRC